MDRSSIIKHFVCIRTTAMKMTRFFRGILTWYSPFANALFIQYPTIARHRHCADILQGHRLKYLITSASRARTVPESQPPTCYLAPLRGISPTSSPLCPHQI
ncbi:hypothetical protein IF2G_05845 [Cordyceps javanica]|nr:hypothetical protein IF2G_05845 [Cordyceps javanica]